MRGKNKEWITLISVSVVLIIWKFAFHELWKDEWQAWLVSRDQSLMEMFSFLNYEGHPSLWYLWLKPFTLLGNYCKEDVLLKIAHSLPVILSMYFLFLRFTGHIFIKLLASLSYFLFFEYGIVCRGYILVVLFSLLTVYAIKQDKKILQTLTIFLLCQTEVYGVMISSLLLLYQYLNYKEFKSFKIPVYGFIAGVALFILSVYPRGNEDDFSRAYNKDKISFSVMKEAFQGNMANIFGIGIIKDTSANGTTGSGIFFSIVLLAMSLYVLKQDRKTMFTWLAGVSAFILFGILIYTGGVRQWGMLFLFFICIIEIYEPFLKDKILFGLVIIMLLAPLYHNIRAMMYELQLPFTNAKEAGAFITEKIPENVPIVSLNKFETANAAAYAERKFYELPNGNQFTYFRWLEKVYLPTQTELVLFSKFKKTKGIVIISPKPINAKRFPFLQLWQAFNKESIKNENYYFYILNMEQLGGNIQ